MNPKDDGTPFTADEVEAILDEALLCNRDEIARFKSQLAASERQRELAEKAYARIADLSHDGAEKLHEMSVRALNAEAKCAGHVQVWNHVLEYWNGGRNDQAMWDALQHILDVAETAIAQDNPGLALLERMKKLEGLLRECLPVVRGKHSRFTYGPTELVERIEAALATLEEK